MPKSKNRKRAKTDHTQIEYDEHGNKKVIHHDKEESIIKQFQTKSKHKEVLSPYKAKMERFRKHVTKVTGADSITSKQIKNSDRERIRKEAKQLANLN